MERSGPETAQRGRATPRPPVGRVCWSFAFGALTMAGLAALAWGLLVLHALAYGAVTVIAPEAHVAAPDSGRHVLAFAVGCVVHLVSASAALWLAARTAARRWRPIAQGLAASLVAATTASCALLLTLGVNPVGFLLDL